MTSIPDYGREYLVILEDILKLDLYRIAQQWFIKMKFICLEEYIVVMMPLIQNIITSMMERLGRK